MIERVPRAVLGNPRSEWVVDETGAVIPRLESMSASVPLPVILGISTSGVKAGMVLETLRPALELIMLTVRSFPDISIIAVNVRNPERLEFFMRFRGQKSCKVILPVRNQNFTYLLSALQSAIIYAERQGDTRGTFDLSFGATSSSADPNGQEGARRRAASLPVRGGALFQRLEPFLEQFLNVLLAVE